MTKYNNKFRRVEKKYLLSAEQYAELNKILAKEMIRDEYFESTVCSVYFDTPDYRMIRNSMENNGYKEKLRLRCYGIPGPDTNCFIELKKKYGGVCYKRRINMKYSQAYDYLYNNIKPADDSQIEREIDYALAFYEDIRPAVLVAYDRLAYVHKDNSELRITFDSNIRWRRTELDLTKGLSGQSQLKNGECVMEIKIPGAMPLWLSHALDNLNIYPVSFSKFANAYLSIIQSDKSIYTNGGLKNA